jgi:hypothetical protein
MSINKSIGKIGNREGKGVRLGLCHN